MLLNKRSFLAGGIALGASAPMVALAQRAREPIPHRTATTRPLFKAPAGSLPNAVAVVPEGVWIAEQKMSGPLAKQYNMPEPADLREAAWLVDWNGKVLKTIMTESRNTSGMTVGGGYLWMGAEFPGNDGIYQYDMNGKLVSRRQVPLGPQDDGGGIHGALWHDGKLWMLANRLHAILRVDPVSWMPEFQIPLSNLAQRYHAIAWADDVPGGAVWAVTGNNSKSYKEGQYGLHKYEAATGRLLEIVDFAPGSADPHGLAMHDGKLISCDAGIHPGWPNFDSPFSRSIFEINLV
jgi:streptogramin lyase